MTLIEALQNAREFLEHIGYTGGDVHDNLNIAIQTLLHQHTRIALQDLVGPDYEPVERGA
jgi:hypothetical protein